MTIKNHQNLEFFWISCTIRCKSLKQLLQSFEMTKRTLRLLQYEKFHHYRYRNMTLNSEKCSKFGIFGINLPMRGDIEL